MDPITIICAVVGIISFVVSLSIKNEKVKSIATKILSIAAVIAVIYSAYGNLFAPDEPNVPNDPEIVITDPSQDPDPVTDPTPVPTPTPTADPAAEPGGSEGSLIDENGTYDSKDEVALYIHTYGKLPQNYITKAEAEKLGWNGGSVEKYAPGKCIGGSRFYNSEKKLPEKSGRIYYECDIDTLNYHSRGTRRIVYSNDGLIYYTHDHYDTFELLYGDE